MNNDEPGHASSRVPGRVPGNATGNVGDERSFLQRYRLPLFLALVAVCLYAGSILYILYGRGQV